MRFYHRVMSPKDADGMINSVYPDQEQSICLKTYDHYKTINK